MKTGHDMTIKKRWFGTLRTAGRWEIARMGCPLWVPARGRDCLMYATIPCYGVHLFLKNSQGDLRRRRIEKLAACRANLSLLLRCEVRQPLLFAYGHVDTIVFCSFGKHSNHQISDGSRKLFPVSCLLCLSRAMPWQASDGVLLM